MNIEAKDLSKVYNSGENRVVALDHANLEIVSSDFISIMGPSGSGKSTLLHLLSGLDRPTSGSLTYDGKDIYSYSDKELSAFRRKRIGFIFQQFNLLPVLTAKENIIMPLLLDKKQPDEAYLKQLTELLGKPEYYTESGIAWITPKDLSNNKSKFVSHGENDITELGLRNSSASIMPEGTVLFSSRAPIGYIAIAAGEVTTNQGFKSVVPKPEIGTPFVYFFLKNTLPVIEGMASGSTFKEVSGSTMKNVPAVIPDAETLAKFSDFCAPIFAQQRILEEQNQSLATLRDNLLPKLMSGEIDVSAVQL